MCFPDVLSRVTTDSYLRGRWMSEPVASLSFEDALAELETLVKSLEGGQQRLEDAISCYERGATLRNHCETKLAEAEERVEAIVAGAEGSTTLRAETVSAGELQ